MRPLIALARMGWRYDLITLERVEDLMHTEHLKRTREALVEAGVRWDFATYRAESTRGAIVGNLTQLAHLIARSVRREPLALIHARSYVSSLLAMTLGGIHRIPFLFDTRGFWIDELREEGRRFTDPLTYGVGKQLERALFTRCAGAVCLAETGAEDITQGVFAPWPTERAVRVIPTCVDYEAFEHVDHALSAEVTRRLEGRLVIGYIGSLNASYKVEESLALFSALRRERQDVFLLGVTRQQDMLRKQLRAHGICEDDFLITSAQHYEMPAYLSACHWGFLLLKTSFAKRASMPTKLAEFFAAGVRPIQYGCNQSVADWVRIAGSGVVLDGLDPSALSRAAKTIAAKGLGSTELLERAREATRAHFSLRSGVCAYDALLREVIGAGPESLTV